MNKEFFYKRIEEIFKEEKSRNLFKKQVDIYLELKEQPKQKTTYKIGDDVFLKKGMFLRGEGALQELSEEKLNFVRENGFLSPDITIEHNPNQKTPLCIPVWNIKNDMYLKDYINLYSGATFLYTTKEDNYKKHTCLVPYKELENHIETFRNKDYWMWTCEQTKEIRFMPNLAKDDPKVQLAFIMNMEGAEKLIENDIFNLNFDKEVLEASIKEIFTKDFIYGERNDFTTNREGALTFGIPGNFIEGLLVGRIYEKNIIILEKLKKHFPNCYICNIDGKVIK